MLFASAHLVRSILCHVDDASSLFVKETNLLLDKTEPPPLTPIIDDRTNQSVRNLSKVVGW